MAVNCSAAPVWKSPSKSEQRRLVWGLDSSAPYHFCIQGLEDRMKLTMTLPDDKVSKKKKKNNKSWLRRSAECHPKHSNDPKLTATLLLQGLSPEGSNVEDREVEAIGDEELVAGQACM